VQRLVVLRIQAGYGLRAGLLVRTSLEVYEAAKPSPLVSVSALSYFRHVLHSTNRCRGEIPSPWSRTLRPGVS